MITNQQYRRLKVELSKGKTVQVASSKTGMSERTARKYKNMPVLPSDLKITHAWKTRNDPFEGIWESVLEKLEVNSGLEAKTLFQWLQREYSGSFQDGQLRTLQRKIKVWRATEGPGREVMFPQVHHPGNLCESDFTSMNALLITINKEPFNHLLYHFVLTYSNWESVTVCFSESLESLSEGLQNALWDIGGVPQRHRSDRLSAAVNNNCDEKKFTSRYKALLNHYSLTGEKIQAGKANENGDVEQRHYRLKKALEQSLLLRGSRDFSNREEYNYFLKKLVNELNIGRKERLGKEQNILRSLPGKRIESCNRQNLKVGPSSTINLLHNVYSVHSRLVGESIEARAYAEYIEIWYAQRKVDKFPRLRGEYNYRINYRHIIDWLIRKPGAFENYRYREGLFPTSQFRMAYDRLKQDHAPNKAAKEYLKILHLAAKESESKVINALNILFEFEEPISFDGVSLFVFSEKDYCYLEEVSISSPDLKAYDELLDQRGAMIWNLKKT